MALALPLGEAHRAAGIVERGSRIDQDRDPVDSEPQRKGVGVAMGGQGQIAERAVIDHEIEVPPGGLLMSDSIAAVAVQADAVRYGAGTGGHREQGIAQVLVPSRWKEIDPAGQAGDRRDHRGDVTRLAIRGLGDDPALVIVADRRNMSVPIHQRAQEAGRRGESVGDGGCEGASLKHSDEGRESDHLAGEGLIARRLLGARPVRQDLR